MKYVQAIGLEIEGGWFKIPPEPNRHGDGSVQIRPSLKGKRLDFIGELSSAPICELNLVKKWIYDNWPDVRNRTCGFHIHVSFTKIESYVNLMDKKFYEDFLVSAEEFARSQRLSKAFFHRLQGKNRYCKREWLAEKQAVARERTGDRYAHLNFCYGLHKTLENRLPTAMMTRRKAFNTVNWYINEIEKFLDKKQPLNQEVCFEIVQKKDEEILEIVLD